MPKLFYFYFFHVIIQPVYCFIVRCRTFVMQTEIPASAWTMLFLPWGSYMEHQVFSGCGIQKRGSNSWDISPTKAWGTVFHHRNRPGSGKLRFFPPPCSGWAPLMVASCSCTISILGLVIMYRVYFRCYSSSLAQIIKSTPPPQKNMVGIAWFRQTMGWQW
jgi:hypothetical protein